jgi:hypothetical protein
MKKYSFIVKDGFLVGAVNCVDCAPATVPSISTVCQIGTKKGGFERVIMISCKVLLADQAELATLLSGGTAQTWTGAAYEAKTLQEIIDLGLAGLLMDSVTGNLSKTNSSTQKLASCLPEQVTNNTWTILAGTKVFDKSGAYVDCDVFNHIVENSQYYHLVFQSCEETTEAIGFLSGSWSLADVDYQIPEDGVNEIQMKSISASVTQLVPPCPVLAPVLDTITFA